MRLPLAHALLILAAVSPLAAQDLPLARTTFAEVSRNNAPSLAPALRPSPVSTSAFWTPSASPTGGGSMGQDTILPWTPQPKEFGVAMIDVGLSWLVPWTFNYYVRDAEFAHVGPDSWFDNLTNPWVWDDNNFNTNMFGHPYQGHMYFTSGRANGFNFWASSGFAAFGAWGWEIFGETHPPAPNDLASTTLGGIAMGEATYRLATLLTDNTATGAGRTWREIGSFVINPVYGFNRLMRGEMTRRWENPPDRIPSRFAVLLTAGAQSIVTELPPEDLDKTGQVTGTLDLLYGNPLTDNFAKPFSTFTAKVDVASRNSGVIQELAYEGTLIGRHIGPTEAEGGDGDRGFLVLSDRFQYLTNVAFEYGGMSLVGMLGRHWKPGGDWSIVARGGPGVVMFGATPSSMLIGEGRDYDFVSGVMATAAADLLRKGRRIARLGFDSEWLYTVNGVADRHQLNGVVGEVQVPIHDRLAAGLRWLGYWGNSYYTTDPDEHTHSHMARLFASWTFGTEPNR